MYFSIINSYILPTAYKLTEHCVWHLGNNITCLHASYIYISCC